MCVCVAADICVVVISAESIQTWRASQMTQEESSIPRRHGAFTQLQVSRLTFETNFHHNFHTCEMFHCEVNSTRGQPSYNAEAEWKVHSSGRVLQVLGISD